MTDRAPTIVVAAALIRAGQVLAAQRTYPPELAGQWELPGGKVDGVESETSALQRECREELGVDVTVHERIGRDLSTANVEGVLRVYRCELGAGEPVAAEHQALRWVGPEALEALPWLGSNRPLIPDLARLLRG